jgi:hypothetical protein
MRAKWVCAPAPAGSRSADSLAVCVAGSLIRHIRQWEHVPASRYATTGRSCLGFLYIYCTQPSHAEVTKLLCPHHEGACSPHPIRVGGPDLWYQMALVDTTAEQSLVSSA